jgi:hypothetical protein
MQVCKGRPKDQKKEVKLSRNDRGKLDVGQLAGFLFLSGGICWRFVRRGGYLNTRFDLAAATPCSCTEKAPSRLLGLAVRQGKRMARWRLVVGWVGEPERRGSMANSGSDSGNGSGSGSGKRQSVFLGGGWRPGTMSKEEEHAELVLPGQEREKHEMTTVALWRWLEPCPLADLGTFAKAIDGQTRPAHCRALHVRKYIGQSAKLPYSTVLTYYCLP